MFGDLGGGHIGLEVVEVLPTCVGNPPAISHRLGAVPRLPARQAGRSFVEALGEAHAPRRPAGLPPELALRLGVRRPPDLGHHQHRRLRRPAAGPRSGERSSACGPRSARPGTAAARAPAPARRRRRCRSRPTPVDGRHGGAGRVLDVHERPDTAAAADDREPPLPDGPSSAAPRDRH